MYNIYGLRYSIYFIYTKIAHLKKINTHTIILNSIKVFLQQSNTTYQKKNPKMHILFFILKETSKYNFSTLYHLYYMLQTSTIRKLSILFVFTPSIENSMFPRRAIFATSFCVLHSSSHKHNQEKLPKWHHLLTEPQPIWKEYVLPYKCNGCTKR